uniref:Acidic fibroblast growth factor intracellular-binding protein n=2 Tax=Denticeps clupeoides TaxID=299321 RepID=A0AAY4D9I8_9TELE
MSVELDVFVGNTTIMDQEVYQLWLSGYTVGDAVKVRMDGGVLDGCDASAEVLRSDTMDQFRTFQMCERLLHNPAKLANQLLFQIPPDRQAMLIDRYYAFDDAFVREVLGKKLSKGTKKDLDDVSSKTGILLKSCRRQFDNFKRVFKVVEELKGPLVENIRQHLLLSDRLARDYAAIVFFANHRFETGKKKLQYLTFQDFAFCAGELISHWTVGAMDNQLEDMDVDLDKEFLQDLKELKVLITDKDLLDQHKSLVCTALRSKTKVFAEMEASFKNLSRGLINIAAKLTNTKDVRDLFIDLVEKFIEPCRSDRWVTIDVNLYLTHYINSAHILDTFKHQAVWNSLWDELFKMLTDIQHVTVCFLVKMGMVASGASAAAEGTRATAASSEEPVPVHPTQFTTSISFSFRDMLNVGCRAWPHSG